MRSNLKVRIALSVPEIIGVWYIYYFLLLFATLQARSQKNVSGGLCPRGRPWMEGPKVPSEARRHEAPERRGRFVGAPILQCCSLAR